MSNYVKIKYNVKKVFQNIAAFDLILIQVQKFKRFTLLQKKELSNNQQGKHTKSGTNISLLFQQLPGRQ